MVGRHRSGTTWTTNILASHPDVFTPTHEAHHGQHESEFFSSVVAYCRQGQLWTDRMAIKSIFERSDFWHLLFPQGAPSLDIDELGVYGYFAAAMDKAAEQRQRSHWVEKTPAHTLLLADLIKMYPDALFIGVDRDRLATARSNVHLFANPARARDWLKASVKNEIYAAVMRRHTERVHIVRYEDLVQNSVNETSRLLTLAGLEPVNNINSSWERDSSFGGQAPAVPLRFKLIVMTTGLGSRLVPDAFVEWYARGRVKKVDKPLPAWFYRVFAGAAGSVGR